MHIAVYGANGRVGTLFVHAAVESGHTVTAFVHSSNPFSDMPAVTVAKGDIYDATSVAAALQGADVVVSTLGSWGTPNKDIVSSGVRNIIPAMQTKGIHRIVTLTGSGAFTSSDKPTLFDKLMRRFFSIIGRKILIDSEQHIALLEKSGLDWTILRSPVMTDGGLSGRFRLSEQFPSPFATIARKDVVAALLQLATSKDYLRQAPNIFRK